MNPSKARPTSHKINTMATYLVMTLLVVTSVLPFLWMLSTSFKSKEYILQSTPQFIPETVSFDSYVQLAERIDLPRTMFNSMFAAVMGLTGQLVVASLAAYAFSRLEWRGRDTVFFLYLATLMIPSVVLIIPQFILVRSLGWVNTFMALIIPGLFSPFGTFLLRQAFKGIPKDFDEAAMIDGANHFTIYWRVILPMVKPTLATLALLGFMERWNDYLWPLFVARRPEVITLPVALAGLQGGPRSLTEWNMVMAGAMVTVLPILIVYIFTQRWFTQGVMASGLKG
ncbi:MAG: carbohydrate ABC transporter permease [Anaerolineaceae bacterium]|nr:carbohydrate ABC transporter permease [Anaerolineaceae bacterium]